MSTLNVLYCLEYLSRTACFSSFKCFLSLLMLRWIELWVATFQLSLPKFGKHINCGNELCEFRSRWAFVVYSVMKNWWLLKWLPRSIICSPSPLFLSMLFITNFLEIFRDTGLCVKRSEEMKRSAKARRFNSTEKSTKTNKRPKSNQKKKNDKIDVNKPKKPPTAFFYFLYVPFSHCHLI